MSRHLGLDLGGTNIKWVVLERHGDVWEAVDRGHVPTPEGGPEVVTDALISAGRGALAACPGLETVGLGVPGLYYPESGDTRFLVNIEGEWDRFPVGSMISDGLGLPTHLVNDARAFGLAELRLGAGRGATSMIGWTLGTGVGGVIAIDGRVVQGHDGTAGEMGHQTIDPAGPPCNCGNNGCVEAFVRADRIALACQSDTVEEAVERARGGDAVCLAGLAETGRYLGIGVANMVTVLAPDRVVIGGGVAAALDLMLPTLRAELHRRVHTTDLDRVEIVPAELGTWAGGIGAAVHGAETAA
ncbi:MAG: ROK family protein [Chloroflexota bacterium]